MMQSWPAHHDLVVDLGSTYSDSHGADFGSSGDFGDHAIGDGGGHDAGGGGGGGGGGSD
jgi:hypothetical protein